MFVASIILCIASGLAMAFQSPTNTALSTHVGNAQATLISFGGGVIVLAVGVLLFGQGDLGALAQAPAWEWLGGLYGVIVVIVVTYATPVLGVALTITAIMLGQLCMGVVIDSAGLFLVSPIAISPLRAIGLLLVAVGIVAIYADKKMRQEKSKGNKGGTLAMTALSFASGVGSAIQAPTNAALSTHVGNIEASLVSFVGGFILILVYTLVMYRGKLKPIRKIAPWKFLGGVYGAAVVFIVVIATPYLGVGLLLVSQVLGQLGGAMLIDAKGLLLSPKVGLSKLRVAGVVVIAFGIVLIALAA